MNLSQKEQTVSKIREFNRFYMPKLDLLNRVYLDSEYSVIEARILFEIAENSKNSEYFANLLVKELQIDKSYLSRILKNFEKQELIKRVVSDNDARFYKIIPTKKCEKITAELIEKSNEKTRDILTGLSEKECEKITKSINTIMEILSKKGK